MMVCFSHRGAMFRLVDAGGSAVDHGCVDKCRGPGIPDPPDDSDIASRVGVSLLPLSAIAACAGRC